MTSTMRTAIFAVVVLGGGLFWGLWEEWPELRADKDENVSAPVTAGTPAQLSTLQPAGKEFTYSFDSDKPGQLPPNFHTALTGRGSPGNWLVQADPTAPSNPNVLAQTSTDKTDYRFPLAIADDGSFRDFDLSVRFKAVSGKVDQAGGLVFRLRDANNYYVVRANALEGNYNLYRVVNGTRREITGSKLRVTAGEWHEFRVEVRGNHLSCYFDGTKKIEATDDTFKDPGKIGLWTKADSVTSFDDLKVSAK